MPYISPGIFLLLSADSTGLIKLPGGNAGEVEAITRQLALLEELKLLTRPAGNGSNGPFQLTEKGANLKSLLEKS